MKVTSKISDSDAAFVRGMIDTVYASLNAMKGQGDGKVYHRYTLGSSEELAWHKGCQWTANRLMWDANAALFHKETGIVPLNRASLRDAGFL